MFILSLFQNEKGQKTQDFFSISLNFVLWQHYAVRATGTKLKKFYGPWTIDHGLPDQKPLNPFKAS